MGLPKEANGIFIKLFLKNIIDWENQKSYLFMLKAFFLIVVAIRILKEVDGSAKSVCLK